MDVHRFAPSIRVDLSYRTKHNETGAPCRAIRDQRSPPGRAMTFDAVVSDYGSR